MNGGRRGSALIAVERPPYGVGCGVRRTLQLRRAGWWNLLVDLIQSGQL